MHRPLGTLVTLGLLLLTIGCDGDNRPLPEIVVNSLEDLDQPPEGVVTLRSALAEAGDAQRIVFDASLDGGTIALSMVGEEHSVLKGEVMGIRDEPSGPVSYLVGYFDRDYGRSALYARKDVVIDASTLPAGITLAWTGGRSNPARVLAVYGNLSLTNVSITGGINITEDISTADPDQQPWTLARGGAVAVWGIARLVDCEIHDNHVEGDFDSSRDRGAFGGGVFANIVDMEACVVSGNSVLGAGAAGGGVYSVGGAQSTRRRSEIEASSITGNRISGLFTYGGGVYSDGGGIGSAKTLRVANSTVARNLVEPAPGLPPFVLSIGYWRGGGIYVSNGNLIVKTSTVTENQVHGVPRTDSLGRPNLAGGIAATIGNAHAVEDLMIGHSIVTGNTVHEIGGMSYDHDVFTGSAFYFRSLGYNRFGVLDFSQMLVPVGVPDWASLSRRHYPQDGDEDGLTADEVLNLSGGIVRSSTVRSVGVDAPELAVLHYQPMGSALDQLPTRLYFLTEVIGEYDVDEGGVDDFLFIVLERIEGHFALPNFAVDFAVDFEAFLRSVDLDEVADGLQPYLDPSGNPILTLADTHWFGPAQTWPKELENHPYIEFWHRLEEALQAEDLPDLGPEVLGDEVWAALFSTGRLTENSDIIVWIVGQTRLAVQIEERDQLGTARPAGSPADIGAVELP